MSVSLPSVSLPSDSSPADSTQSDLTALFRPAIRALAGYVPGEQPQTDGWVKLNTNELPYPPSPKAIAAMQTAAGDRLRIYPDPLGRDFCNAVAERYGVEPEMVLPGNGSDDCLTILVRSFLDAGDRLALPYPSYILYETLGNIQGCASERICLNEDWTFDLDAAREVAARAKILFIPCPNSPSGTVWDDDTILSLVPPRGILVLDEAYVDFRDPLSESAGDGHGFRGFDILKRPEAERVVVTRTLSKSAGLAGLRIGYMVAHPKLIAGMRNVKDSYNCDAVSLAGGAAAIRDVSYAVDVAARIRATRDTMTRDLRGLGFTVVDSQANFVWTRHESGRNDDIYEALKANRVLIRNMKYPDAVGVNTHGLRMSVGSDAECERLLEVLAAVV